MMRISVAETFKRIRPLILMRLMMEQVLELDSTASTRSSTLESMGKAEGQLQVWVEAVATSTTHRMKPLVEKDTTTTMLSRKKKPVINSMNIPT